MSTITRTGKRKTAVSIVSGSSEGAIFSRVLEPDQATLPVAAAKAILTFGFSEADQDRMRELAAKVREGTLSPDEQTEINNYERVGHILSLMKLKANRSLKKRSASRKAKVH
jgi:hypothetical protein